MPTPDIELVLLDFGGVLADEGFAEGLKEIARHAGRDEHDIWQAGLSAVWDSGYVTGRADEAAFWRLFKERTGLEGDETAWRERIWSLFAVRPFMRELTQALTARGLRAAILSDQTDWLACLDERQDFFKHFERVYNSYDWGLTKKEPAFFHKVLEDMGVTPARALFVDDNPGNVELARTLGLQAILYTDRQDFLRQARVFFPDLQA